MMRSMAVFDVAAEGSSGAEAAEEVAVAQPVPAVAIATAVAESLELTSPSVASASVLQPQQEEAQEEQQHLREQNQEEQQQFEEKGELEEEQLREQEQQQAQQSEQEEQQVQHEEEQDEEGEEEEQQQPSLTEPGSGGLGVLLVHHNMLYSLKDAEQHTSACSSAQASVTCLDLRPKGHAPGPQHLSAGRHTGDLELTQHGDGLYEYDSGDEGDGDVRVGGSMDSQQDEVHCSPGTPDSLAALSASYRTGHSSGSNQADNSPAAGSCSCSVQMFRQARGSGPQGLLDSQLAGCAVGAGQSAVAVDKAAGSSTPLCEARSSSALLSSWLLHTSDDAAGANSSGLGYSDTTTGCSGGESSCSAKKRPRELVALPFTSLEQLEAGTDCEAPAAAASFTSQGTPHPPTTHLILKDQPGALSSQAHPKPFVFKFSEDHLPDRLAGSVGPLHHLQQSK
ncbi:reticulocyte-binding protein 2 homolog a, partial [Haematococcus lacustris]